MEKVTVARRLRAMARDRGKTSPSAGLELERLAEDVAALEELEEAARAHMENHGGLATIFSRTGLHLETVLEELKAREERR